MDVGNGMYFSNFDSLKSTETNASLLSAAALLDFSNFDSLKSTETVWEGVRRNDEISFQQFRLVEEY